MGNQSCKIDNGQGEKSWWPWSECKVTECDQGYEEEDNECVVLSGPCTLNPAVTNALTYVYNSDGVCIVEKCEAGYILRDGKCTPAGSGSESGTPTPPLKTVDGYNQDVVNKFKLFDTYNETTTPRVLTIQACADLTKARGGDAFTYRDSSETATGFANTCLGYGYMPRVYALVGDMQTAPAQKSACVDPTKTFPDCGIAVPGWNSAVLSKYQTFDTSQNGDINKNTDFSTMKSCADVAKFRGAVAFTYRNSYNNYPYNYTCIGIGTVPDGYTLTGGMVDTIKATSACVDGSKTFPNC